MAVGGFLGILRCFYCFLVIEIKLNFRKWKLDFRKWKFKTIKILIWTKTDAKMRYCHPNSCLVSRMTFILSNFSLLWNIAKDKKIKTKFKFFSLSTYRITFRHNALFNDFFRLWTWTERRIYNFIILFAINYGRLLTYSTCNGTLDRNTNDYDT